MCVFINVSDLTKWFYDGFCPLLKQNNTTVKAMPQEEKITLKVTSILVSY